ERAGAGRLPCRAGEAPMSAGAPIRVGISACLLGRAVRFDGGHKRDAFLTETLGRFVEWVPVCPEVELGLGVPRPTLRLERRGGALRLGRPAGRRRPHAAAPPPPPRPAAPPSSPGTTSAATC